MLHIEELAIEVTRRCNSDCWGCLRGEPENRDFNVKWLPNIFKNISVGTLVLTGGEVACAPQVLRDFKRFLDLNLVQYNTWYIKTNGMIRSRNLVALCKSLHIWEQDGGISALELSLDNMHYSNMVDMGFWYGVKGTNDFDVFFDKRGYTVEGMIKMGRLSGARNARDIRLHIANEPYAISRSKSDGGLILRTPSIYVNALGDVVTSVNLSYEAQEQLKIGSIRNKPLYDLLIDPITAKKANKIVRAARDWVKSQGLEG